MNLLILLLFSALAIVGIIGTYFLAYDVFEFDEEDPKKKLWEYFCVCLYAIWATLLSRYIG